MYFKFNCIYIHIHMYLYVFIYTDTYWYIHIVYIVYMYLFMALVRNQHVLSSLCAFSFASQVEVEEFLMGCLRLRGPATAIDMGKVIRDQNWLVQTVGSLACFLFLFFFSVDIFLKHLKLFRDF